MFCGQCATTAISVGGDAAAAAFEDKVKLGQRRPRYPVEQNYFIWRSLMVVSKGCQENHNAVGITTVPGQRMQERNQPVQHFKLEKQ